MKARGEYLGVYGFWFNGRERFVATPHGFNKLRARLKERAASFCENCGRFDANGHAHHINLRKMGGGARDDRLENLQYLCGICHRKEHNQ